MGDENDNVLLIYQI